jgi:hypothetical protein
MHNFESNPAPCKPETRASDCATDENVEIALPMNDVFSISFVSKIDPFFDELEQSRTGRHHMSASELQLAIDALTRVWERNFMRPRVRATRPRNKAEKHAR